MSTLKKLMGEITITTNSSGEIVGLLGPESQASITNIKNASTVLNTCIQRVADHIRQIVYTFSGLTGRTDDQVRLNLELLGMQLKTSDVSVHDMEGYAAELSVAIQPVIGQLSETRRQFSQQVAEAKAAKEEADFQVNKLQYAIDNAGKYVSPYFGPGEPRTRQLVMFSTATADVKERMVKIIALRVEAAAKEVFLANRLILLNKITDKLESLGNTDELLNACRAAIVRLDVDMESGRTKEQRILATGSNKLAEFYTKQLSSAIADIQRILG